MDEKFKDFLEILLDSSPVYIISTFGVYDEATGVTTEEYFLIYHEYSDSLYFRSFLNNEKVKFIIELKNQLSSGKVRNKYVQNLREELEKCINSFYVFDSNNIEYKIQKDAILNDHRLQNNVKEVNPNNIPKSFLKDFLNFNQYKFELITSLIQELSLLEQTYPEVLPSHTEPSTINTEEQPIEKKKLNVNLSVSDVALLFRLLDEEKVLSYTYKTDIYRFIANSFITERQDEISEASVKNKFLSPDNTSIRNLDVLLVNLKQHLKKIH